MAARTRFHPHKNASRIPAGNRVTEYPRVLAGTRLYYYVLVLRHSITALYNALRNLGLASVCTLPHPHLRNALPRTELVWVNMVDLTQLRTPNHAESPAALKRIALAKVSLGCNANSRTLTQCVVTHRVSLG